MEKTYFVHPTAIIEEPVEIGDKTQIWHFGHVMSGAKIGENCILGQNVFIGRGVILGNNVKVQNNVSVYDTVVLEDGVFCGPSMVFTNVINPREFYLKEVGVSKDPGEEGGDDRSECHDRLRAYDW